MGLNKEENQAGENEDKNSDKLVLGRKEGTSASLDIGSNL